MKKYTTAVFCFLLFLLLFWSPAAVCADPSNLAEFQEISVLDIIDNVNEYQNVRISGNLLEKTGAQQYIFSDGIEQIIVYIPDEFFPYPYKITSENEIEITGQVIWKNPQEPEIYVNGFYIRK